MCVMKIAAIQAVNDLNIFKKSMVQNLESKKCPCPEKKASPIKLFSQNLLKDTFEIQCCEKR